MSASKGWLIDGGVHNAALPDRVKQARCEKAQGRASQVAHHPMFTVIWDTW
jgi:hypothetical protein